MFQKKNSATRIMLAAVAAVGLVLSAMGSQAQAFTFSDTNTSGDGDVVVAIYGNGTEALYNLGSVSSVFNATNGTQSIAVNLSATAGTAPISFAVFGTDGTNERAWGGTLANSVGRTNIFVNTQIAALSQWATALVFNPMSGDTIAKSDTRSFSSEITQQNTIGDASTLGGAWFNQNMFGHVGDTLNILETGNGDPVVQLLGHVQLLANGTLLFGNPGPTAVPVPAAAVLFGSGLIGLAGLARRSFIAKA